ncbi:3-methyl-2-oxobutanoate hydroxymethyltransferase [Pseudofrancisella aestuarii]|uniref:3-methyl-2-oxobutanoate hydroxymethyltransferase n=1 Tax=Pseudofrancisella aestuarii TaxID=2670347 RepID=A0ABV9TCQ1_9GAMM|nr:3-methyl-2-oxobutanoate hydroxymethyltransferase [Pseudofrancisella aestuarii]
MTKVKNKLLPSQLLNYKRNKKKISMLTCYDYSFACIANESEIDILLVGDSGVMTIFGYPDTTHATIEMMESMTKAVHSGAPNKFIVGDMPFLSNRKGIKYAVECAEKLIKAGANSIKIEGVEGHADVIEHIVNSGIPVMGHLGLTPQSVNSLGYKVQGKTIDSAELIKQQALLLQRLGCFAVVLECVPSVLAKEITELLDIPVIGIGAGKDVDGQVLVLQDMLGMTLNLKPKFVRHFFSGFTDIKTAFDKYHDEVNNISYPAQSESYDIQIA